MLVHDGSFSLRSLLWNLLHPMTPADSIRRLVRESDTPLALQFFHAHSLDEPSAHGYAILRQRSDHFVRPRLHSDPLKGVTDFLTEARCFLFGLSHSPSTATGWLMGPLAGLIALYHSGMKGSTFESSYRSRTLLGGETLASARGSTPAACWEP